MHIAIIGAGALGTYFGARWLDAGADVTFIVRENRWKQIQKNGLAVHSVLGDTNVDHATYLKDPSKAKDVDVIVLAVKGYHLDGVIPTIKQMISDKTFILPILNGFEHYATLQETFGEERVLGGLANIIATLNEKGHVEHTSNIHELRFGILHNKQAGICEQLAKLSEKSNMHAIYSDTILKDIWYKYMFITAFSGITTATDCAIGQIRRTPETMEIVTMLLHEMKQIANRNEELLNELDVKKAIKTLKTLHEDATSSMHQDYRKGLTIELDHLQGYSLQLAKDNHINTPYLETIYSLIKAKVE